MKQLKDASKELLDNLIFALNHSMDLKKNGADPMVPFAIVVKGNNRTLKAFAGDSPDYAEKMFEKTLLEERPDYAIYACDSYLTVEGIKYDAVLLKAFDKNDSEIYLIGQKFRPKTEISDFEQIGNPGFLGTVKNTVSSKSADGNQNEARKGKRPWWKF